MSKIIIDDEEKARRIIGDYLRNEGFDVAEGASGMDGIEKIPPSMILISFCWMSECEKWMDLKRLKK